MAWYNSFYLVYKKIIEESIKQLINVARMAMIPRVYVIYQFPLRIQSNGAGRSNNPHRANGTRADGVHEN